MTDHEDIRKALAESNSISPHPWHMGCDRVLDAHGRLVVDLDTVTFEDGIVIASAPTWLATLLAENADLQARLDAMTNQAVMASGRRATIVDGSRDAEIATLRAENARISRPTLTTFNDDGEFVQWQPTEEMYANNRDDLIEIRNVAMSLRWFFVGVTQWENRRHREVLERAQNGHRDARIQRDQRAVEVESLRAKVEALEAALPTDDEIDLIRQGIYGDDRMSRETLIGALGALDRVERAKGGG